MRKALLTCTLLAVPMVALAAPDFESRDLFNPDDGFITVDNATGLEWLDVTLTQGLTVDSVMSGTGGWLAAGFRYATFDDLSTMLLNAGLTPYDSSPFGSKAFIENLRSTDGFGPQLAGLLGPTSGNPTTVMEVGGYTAPIPCTGSPLACEDMPFSTYHVRLNAFAPSHELGGIYDAGMTVSDSPVSTAGSVYPSAGSWLVRGTYSSVPEPGTVGLFALGLVMLWVTRGRQFSRA